MEITKTPFSTFRDKLSPQNRSSEYTVTMLQSRMYTYRKRHLTSEDYFCLLYDPQSWKSTLRAISGAGNPIPCTVNGKNKRITYLGSLYFLVINKIWAVKIIYLKINWLRMDEHLKGNGNNSLWGRLNKSKENSEERSICLFVCCCKWLLIICRDVYLISGLCIIQRVVLLRFELVVSRRMTVALRNKELERKTGFFKRID